mmetsp:Transcript_3862/g.348  ORF Transcript_3862/g.348 Transcript_3862/m.348 type:complete len:82 (+) Transcript_3862:23-268(+)
MWLFYKNVYLHQFFYFINYFCFHKSITSLSTNKLSLKDVLVLVSVKDNLLTLLILLILSANSPFSSESFSIFSKNLSSRLP